MTGIIGVLYAPPEMSAGGEHLNYWRLDCEMSSNDIPFLRGKTICVSKLNEIEVHRGKRVEIIGHYLGIRGVTNKHHYFETKSVRLF